MGSIKKKIAVLASGNGSNLASLIKAVNEGIICNAEISLVISNKKDAFALIRAREAGIKSVCVMRKDFTSNEEYDNYIVGIMKEESIDTILLAGYLRILTEPILKAYRNKILNIHPSLLPDFGGVGMYGMKVHEAVIEAGVQYTGCSVHIVNESVDGGPILAQSRVEIQADDTPKTIAEKVLKEEHFLYPYTVNKFLSESI